ncbi:MAG: ISL3 family transposase, partial [Bacilli bacterium]
KYGYYATNLVTVKSGMQGTWRHLDFFQYQTILHARFPRILCHSCKKILTVQVDWARPQAAFTWFFDSYVMSLMKEMPVNAVARLVKEHDTRLWRIFHYYVNRAMNNLDFTKVKRIAMDETSSKRGHQYVTLFLDVDTKKVLFATEGKSADSLLVFKYFLKEKGLSTDQIEEFCCDMSPAFIKGIQEQFPKSQITFDKFHVMKMVNEAVDQVRREEQSDTPELKKTRFLWLKNENNLSVKQKQHFVKLKDMNLKTAKAYRLKLGLQDLWSVKAIFADLYFQEWYQWAIRTKIIPMIDVAKSLKRHEDGILRWFQTKMTNGLLEGVNSLVQATKRKARGYRSASNFIAMIYATVNKLDVSVNPH